MGIKTQDRRTDMRSASVSLARTWCSTGVNKIQCVHYFGRLGSTCSKNKMEATTGLEPVNNGFADRSLTSWVRRPVTLENQLVLKRPSRRTFHSFGFPEHGNIMLFTWSGRRDSNPRQPAWEAGALPLNYSRTLILNDLVGDVGFEPTTSSV